MKCLVIVVTAIPAGCGSGGNDSSQVNDALRDAVIDALLDDATSGETLLRDLVDAPKAECVATNLLNNDALKTSLEESFGRGVVGADLLKAVPDPGQNPEMQRLILGCLSIDDFVGLIDSSMSSSDSTMTDEQRSCLTKELGAIDTEDFVDGFIALQQEDTTGTSATTVMQALTTCLADATSE